ncbi:MAG: putative toxin-antitoxin system toxin component, PIN family [Coriobacteriales bacterium]|jgi:putative PIN family toxin of toxin-antitoxin system|nr:putative toxin-antitoxin system toxin component, PIN family [Coriobacteriales bacterium]
MTRAVIDTNVLVSGLLTSHGNCAVVIEMIQGGQVSVCYDMRILEEYREVLLRPEFGFSKTQVNDLVDLIRLTGEEVIAPRSSQDLPDEDDRMFVEVARKANAPIVTGNMKHFPEVDQVQTPAQFVSHGI